MPKTKAPSIIGSKLILALGVVVVAVATIIYFFSSPSKPQITLSSVKECERIISPLLKKEEDIQEVLDACKKSVTKECNEKLAEVDNAMNIEADWQERVKLFEERKAIADACLSAWHNGPLGLLTNDKDARLLGRGELGQTEALKNLCDESIKDIDEKLKIEKDFSTRRSLYALRERIIDFCLEEWHSGRYDERDIPPLGGNAYNATDTLIADCTEQIRASNNHDAIIKACKKKFTSGNFEKSKEPNWTTLTAQIALVGLFEFYNMDRDFAKSETLPFGNRVHFIVARKSSRYDMRTYLPITVSLSVDGSIAWSGTAAGDPAIVCGDATGCSIDGPLVESSWKNKKIIIEAFGKNGELLAKYTK